MVQLYSHAPASYPDIPIIVLSASENPAHIRKCLDYGITGFVTKSAPKDALFEAISRALKGERYIPDSLRESMPDVAKVMDEVDTGADIEIISGLITPSDRWIFCGISPTGVLTSKLLATLTCRRTR